MRRAWYRPPVPATPLGGIALATTLVFAPTASGVPTTRSDRSLDAAAARDVAAPADVEVPDPVGATPLADVTSDDPEPGPPLDDEPGEDDELDWRTSPEAMQARRRIAGGIALTSVGTLLGIGAIVMASLDPCRPGAGNSCQAAARDRAALVMGLPAIAVLGGGIALLTLGVTKRRRIAAGATASRRGGGLVISGRF